MDMGNPWKHIEFQNLKISDLVLSYGISVSWHLNCKQKILPGLIKPLRI